jgi:hypothetical protein
LQPEFDLKANPPQSNAKVERFHRTLHDLLANKLDDGVTTWDLLLNQTLAAIRFNVSQSNTFSPFFLSIYSPTKVKHHLTC